MADSIAQNKQVVERFLAQQRAGNIMATLDLLTDDVVWLIPGEWEMAGVRDRNGVKEMLEGLDQFKGGLDMQVHSVTAEEDRVALFVSVSAEMKDGRTYRNELAFLFVIRSDKICAVTEMTDSAKSRRFWLGKN